MHVFFDHQCYWEKFGGVSRYFTEILKTNVPDVKYELALKYSNNEYLKELNVNVKSFLDKWNIPKKKYFISAINKPHTIALLKQTEAKIVHLTHYDPYLFKCLKNKTVVSTMHDLNYFAIPQFYKRRTELLKRWQVQCAIQSDMIVTISENSKGDLINYLNISPDRISVIYHGVSNRFTKDNSPAVIRQPYFLFVGMRYGYKNFDIVLDAFKNIKDKYRDIILVCTGNKLDADEMKYINNNGLAERIVQISASENDLVNLYSNALFFVFPSFYEGFGLPILEAMGCGCPVMCSNVSCFPEIAGGAALYFDPYSVEDLTEKMQTMILSSEMRKEFAAKGIDRKNAFTWDVSRQKHLLFYKSIE